MSATKHSALAKVDAEIARLVRLRRQLQSRGVVEWWCNDLVDYIELKDEAFSIGNGDVDSGPLETCIYYRVEWGEWPGDEPRAGVADMRVMVSVSDALPAVDVTHLLPEDALSGYREAVCEHAEELRRQRELQDKSADRYYARMGI